MTNVETIGRSNELSEAAGFPSDADGTLRAINQGADFVDQIVSDYVDALIQPPEGMVRAVARAEDGSILLAPPLAKVALAGLGLHWATHPDLPQDHPILKAKLEEVLCGADVQDTMPQDLLSLASSLLEAGTIYSRPRIW